MDYRHRCHSDLARRAAVFNAPGDPRDTGGGGRHIGAAEGGYATSIQYTCAPELTGIVVLSRKQQFSSRDAYPLAENTTGLGGRRCTAEQTPTLPCA